MKKFVLIFTVLTTAVACFSFCNNTGNTAAKKTAAINWITWEQADSMQKIAPRKVFVDVYTNWCGWCKKMDVNTFENPVIIDVLNKNFYCVKYDAESKSPVTLKGRTFNNNGRYNDIAIAYMGQNMGFPTSLYLDENFNPITQPIASYLDPKQLEQILAYFSGNHYLTTPFETFVQSFKGKVQ